jgi:hypothetical protein
VIQASFVHLTEGNTTDLYALDSQYFVKENEKTYFYSEVKPCLNYPHLIEPIMSAVCSGRKNYSTNADVFIEGKLPHKNCGQPKIKP